MVNFYRGAIESILTGNITNCHSPCMTKDMKDLQQVIKTTSLVPSTKHRWSEMSALNPKDTKRQCPPSHSLFTLLPSDERYISICCHIKRIQRSFTPQAVRLLSSSSTPHCLKWMQQDSKDSTLFRFFKPLWLQKKTINVARTLYNS